MTKFLFRTFRLVPVALLLTAGLPSVSAATLTWDANAATAGQTDGAGAWLNANQWWNGSTNVSWTSGDSAIFGNAGAGGAVTLASPTTVGSLMMNGFTGTYTLGTAGQTITLNNGITLDFGAAATTIASPVTLGGAQTWTNNSRSSALNVSGGVDNNGSLLTIDGNASTTISSAISGSGGLTKNGTGTPSQGVAALTLSAANTYTGTTTVNAGQLNLSGSGTINSTGAIVINGGNLNLVNTAQVDRVSNSAAITSTGGTITYSNTSGANVYTETLGSVTLAGGQLDIVLATNQASTGSQTLTLSGLAQSGSGTITFAAATTGPQASGNKNMIVVSGAGTTAAGQIIGPWATTGTTAALQTDYAVYNANYVVAAGASLTAPGQAGWNSSATAYQFGGAEALSADRTAAALRYTGAANALNLGANNLQTYGLLNGGTGLLTVSGTGALTTPTGGGNLFVTSGNNQISISAPITDNGGAVTLVKSGSSTLTLSGPNTYTGGTVINAGTLTLNSSGALGTTGDITFGGGNYRVPIPNSGFGATGVIQHSASNTTDYSSRIVDSAGPVAINTGGQNVTYGALAASNTGGLLKLGGGTLFLSGNHAYQGTTYVGGGTLQIDGTIASTTLIVGSLNGTGQVLRLGASDVLPSNAAVLVDGQGQVIWDLQGFNQTIDSLVLGSNNGGTRGRVTGSGTSTLTVTGSVTTLSHNGGNGEILVPFLDLNGDTTIFAIQNGSQVADLTISSVIQNGGMRIDAQSGAKLGLLSANTFSGPTMVNVGALQLSNFLALQNSPLDTSGTGTVELTAGVGTYTLGGLIGSKNLASVITVNPANVTTLGLNPVTGATHTYSGVIGNLSPAMAVSKTGDGTQILAGPNTYTGNTTISGGTLLINGSTAAASQFIVNTGGTVGGTGTIGGTVTLNGGRIAPGASIGTLNAGSNIWNGDAIFEFEFSTDGSSGAAGTEWDLLAINGGLDLTGTDSVLIELVSMLNTNNAGPLGSWDPTVDTIWTGFVTTTGSIIGFDPGLFSFDTSGFLNPLDGVFSVALGGLTQANRLDLIYTANIIPEPSRAILFALGLLGLLARRRRLS